MSADYLNGSLKVNLNGSLKVNFTIKQLYECRLLK